MIGRSTYRADRASGRTLDARSHMTTRNERGISICLEAHFAGLVSRLLFFLAVLLVNVLFTLLLVDHHVAVFFTGIIVFSWHAL